MVAITSKQNRNYKHTDIGVIPSDWDVKKVHQVADVRTGPFGSSLHESDYVQNGTPIITVEHLSEQGIVHDNPPMVSDTDKKRLAAYILRANDIVFSRVGSVDRNALVSENENGWLFSGRLLRVRTTDPKINPRFLSYVFHHEPTKQRIRTVAVGQTMASLNTTILRGIELVLPTDEKEQSMIADALSSVDKVIERVEALAHKKRNIRTAAVQQLLTGKRRLPGFKKVWQKQPINDTLDRIVGGGTPSRANPRYWGSKIPWVTVKDFASFDPRGTQEQITKEGLNNSASHFIPRGTLIIATRIALGNAVIYDVDVAINQDLKALFFKRGIDSRFMYYWFQANAKTIAGLGSGSTVMGISLPDLKAIEIAMPEHDEQVAIAAVLSDMDAEIEQLNKKLEKYRVIKVGMMQQLLTGKIRIYGNTK